MVRGTNVRHVAHAETAQNNSAETDLLVRRGRGLTGMTLQNLNTQMNRCFKCEQSETYELLQIRRSSTRLTAC